MGVDLHMQNIHPPEAFLFHRNTTIHTVCLLLQVDLLHKPVSFQSGLCSCLLDPLRIHITGDKDKSARCDHVMLWIIG